jgi:hypothetical protein
LAKEVIEEETKEEKKKRKAEGKKKKDVKIEYITCGSVLWFTLLCKKEVLPEQAEITREFAHRVFEGIPFDFRTALVLKVKSQPLFGRKPAKAPQKMPNSDQIPITPSKITRIFDWHRTCIAWAHTAFLAAPKLSDEETFHAPESNPLQSHCPPHNPRKRTSSSHRHKHALSCQLRKPHREQPH